MAADLERAIQIATEAHEGQTRFDGSPYITHPLRVMHTVAAQGHPEWVQIVAAMHDVIEDSGDKWTFDHLRGEGFGDEIITALELLTKQPSPESISDEERLARYERYIRRLAVNDCARAVKTADLLDNLDLAGLEDTSPKRIINREKYGRALLYLSQLPQSQP